MRLPFNSFDAHPDFIFIVWAIFVNQPLTKNTRFCNIQYRADAIILHKCGKKIRLTHSTTKSGESCG